MKRNDPHLTQKMLDYWTRLGQQMPERDHKSIIKDMADRFDVAPEQIEKEIAEWEAGQGANAP